MHLRVLGMHRFCTFQWINSNSVPFPFDQAPRSSFEKSKICHRHVTYAVKYTEKMWQVFDKNRMSDLKPI